MPKFTKKYMVEDYERLYEHSSLLDLYLFDTQSGSKPDAVESYVDSKDGAVTDAVRVELWRAKSASGGYVVITQSLPNIWYLDDAIRMYADNHSEHTLGIRICLERLRVQRNRLYETSLGRSLSDAEMVADGRL